jgi:hypothetical protein
MEIKELLATGKIKTVMDTHYSLSQMEAAHARRLPFAAYLYLMGRYCGAILPFSSQYASINLLFLYCLVFVLPSFALFFAVLSDNCNILINDSVSLSQFYF